MESLTCNSQASACPEQSMLTWCTVEVRSTTSSSRTLSTVSDDSSVIWSSGASLQSSSAQHTPAMPPPTTAYFMLVVVFNPIQTQILRAPPGAVKSLLIAAFKLYRHKHWTHSQKLVSLKPSYCSFL